MTCFLVTSLPVRLYPARHFRRAGPKSLPLAVERAEPASLTEIGARTAGRGGGALPEASRETWPCHRDCFPEPVSSRGS